MSTLSTRVKGVVLAIRLPNLTYFMRKVNVACAGMINLLRRAGIYMLRLSCKLQVKLTARRLGTESTVSLTVELYPPIQTYDDRILWIEDALRVVVLEELGPEWVLKNYEVN